jgi:hypothetical protein
MVQHSKKFMQLFCKILLIVQETSLWVLYGSQIKNKNLSSQYKTVTFYNGDTVGLLSGGT